MWKEQREKIARDGWANGSTAAQIATELNCGITRNAILGKVHREGWPRLVQAQPVWTEERKREAARLYEADVPLEEIVKQLGGGLTGPAIATFAYRNSIRRPHRPSRDAVFANDRSTSPASLAASRVDGAVNQGRDRVAQKTAETQPARRALSPNMQTDRGKSAPIAAAGSKGAAGAIPSRWRADPPPRPDNEPVTFMDRRHDQCCWPLGDPQDFETFRYCGAPHEREAASYCAYHARIAYTPSMPRSLSRLDPDKPARRANNLDRASPFAEAGA